MGYLYMSSGYFSAIMYNFQCACLVILIISMAKYFINVEIIERELFFFNSFSDYYLLVYTDLKSQSPGAFLTMIQGALNSISKRIQILHPLWHAPVFILFIWLRLVQHWDLVP